MNFVYKISCVVLLISTFWNCILPGFTATLSAKNLFRDARSTNESEVVIEEPEVPEVEKKVEAIIDSIHCRGDNPCGWGRYDDETKQIMFYIQNTCNCSVGLRCLKSDDNEAMGAYVYRCR